MKEDWENINKLSEQKRIEELRSFSMEKWMEIIKNVILSVIYMEVPENWNKKWQEVGVRIKHDNSFTVNPISDEDIDMIFTTMSGEHLEEMNEQSRGHQEENVKKTFEKNKVKGTYELAKYLTKKYDVITVGEQEREMHVYRDGVYFRAENEIIYPEIQRILGDIVTKNAKTECFHKIADMTSHPRNIFFSAPLNLIPLFNGVYDTETKTIAPHSPKYRFTHKFPVIFEGSTDCPKTKAFLGQILNPEQIVILQEWLGYYFYRLYSFKKAIIFVGEGDTGKTTLLETIINLLGKDNISSVSLHKMSSDKFSAAHLYGKHGNLVDELSAKDISDTGNFKMATGNGSISGEYKFGNQFSFQNFSKFTFACNKIPDVKDFDDDAYFARWMVMRFEKTIENKIPNFIQSLITEEERSGLFNFAMRGLERLIANKQFSYHMNSSEIKTEMMKSGSSIAMFCGDCLIKDDGYEISKEDMYEAYSRFCDDNGLAKESIKMLGMKMLSYVKYMTEGLITGNKGRVRGWRNARIIDSDKEFNEFVDQAVSSS